MLSKGKVWRSLSQNCHLFMQMADLPKVSKNLERFAVSLWLADWTDVPVHKLIFIGQPWRLVWKLLGIGM